MIFIPYNQTPKILKPGKKPFNLPSSFIWPQLSSILGFCLFPTSSMGCNHFNTYLPIAASRDIAANKSSRKVLLWVSGLIVPIALAMEGSGAIISSAVKIGLLFKQSQGG